MPQEGLRDNGDARIVCLSPSVNLTPSGGGMVPVPYMVYDLCDHPVNYSSKTFYTGQRVLRLCSRTSHVHGDEAGTGGGVVSGTVGRECEPIGNAMKVNVEGSPVVRHLDRFWMEDRNTVGEALFARNMATPPAPTDDDPLPGSIRLVRTDGSAGDEGRIRSDVGPDPSFFRPGAQLALDDPGGRFGASRLAPAPGPPAQGLLAPPPAAPPITAPPPAEAPPRFDWKRFAKIAAGEEAAGGGPEDPLADLAVVLTFLYFTVRISEDRRRRRCKVGPYHEMRDLCGATMQAHHIVPDYTLRYGNRGEAEADQKRILADPANRSSPKNFPSFDDGMCICLQGNARIPKDSQLAPDDPEREHSLAHGGDAKIAVFGQANTPAGTLSIGDVTRISREAVTAVRPECAKEIYEAIEKEFGDVDEKQLARTTQSLPKGEALNALRAGKVQGYRPPA